MVRDARGVCKNQKTSFVNKSNASDSWANSVEMGAMEVI